MTVTEPNDTDPSVAEAARHDTVSNEQIVSMLKDSNVLVTALLCLGVALGVAASYASPGGAYAAMAVGLMTSVLPLLAFVDQRSFRLPDFMVGPLAAGVAALFVLDTVTGGTTTGDLVSGAATGLGMGLLFLVIAIVMSGGLGMGDIKFAVLAGFVLGTKSLTVAMFALVMLPPFLAVVALIPLFVKFLVLRGNDEDGLSVLGKVKIAYGPYLIAGTVVGLFVPATAAFLTVS